MLQNLISTENLRSNMRLEKVKLGETGNFSPIFLDYLSKNEKLKPFYGEFPEVESFKKQIACKKSFHFQKRVVLNKVLCAQYAGLNKSECLSRNLDLLLQENTFTVTTGHQLNIFTGPLYFIYKIVTAINACKKLKECYPQFNFVPVYWMASEDHDFEEIASFRLFGKKYTWETHQKGAVGRFNPQSIKHILDELPNKISVFENAYRTQPSLACSVRYYVNELFGNEGLVCIDADDKELKSLFKNVIKDDLVNNTASALVEKASKNLEKSGYSSQINPREINFFYLDDQLRERIIKENNTYKVINTDLKFSEKEILKEIENHPEKFSPNVVLRPLYQETILPNLAYIGGPAEIAYWMQLKEVFDHSNEHFPILMPRNFALVINKINAKKFSKLNIDIEDLFLDMQELKNKFISINSENTFELSPEKNVINQLFESIQNKAKDVDQSLEGWVAAEGAKVVKVLENIEKRLKKSEEKNQETELNQLENIKDKLFPSGNLQERTDNFLNFYINNPDLITFLLQKIDAFDYQFNVIIEE